MTGSSFRKRSLSAEVVQAVPEVPLLKKLQSCKKGNELIMILKSPAPFNFRPNCGSSSTARRASRASPCPSFSPSSRSLLPVSCRLEAGTFSTSRPATGLPSAVRVPPTLSASSNGRRPRTSCPSRSLSFFSGSRAASRLSLSVVSPPLSVPCSRGCLPSAPLTFCATSAHRTALFQRLIVRSFLVKLTRSKSSSSGQ